jgi:hypothetical protein
MQAYLRKYSKQLPSVAWGYYPNEFIDLPFELFYTYIQTYLSSIHCRFEWDADVGVFHIEYGTRPLEFGKSIREIGQILAGKIAAVDASTKAFEMFPHLLQLYLDDDENEDAHPVLNDPLDGWSLMDLYVYDDSGSRLYIEFNRTTGSRTTSCYIWRKLRAYFSDILLSRLSYIGFIDGTKYDKSEHADPVRKYLFDDMVSREICTYIMPILKLNN